MKAVHHASYCRNIAAELHSELNPPQAEGPVVHPVFASAVTADHGDSRYVYCHPDDADKGNVKDFDYDWREV